MSQMFLNIVSTFKSDGINAATRQLGAFGKQTQGLGSSLGKLGATIASFGLITKSITFFGNAIDGARDLERNLFGVQKVFGDFAPIIERFTANANEMGLSQSKAAKASTFLGSVLKQSGFAMNDVSSITQTLVERAVDLATLYGYDVQEALLGMTALFRGEYDPIEKFGVAMKQSEVNSELAAKKLDHLTGSARRYQEQIIRLELFTQRSADSVGAFAEQSDNLFAKQKQLTANFENMQAAVGQQLTPAMVELTNALFPLVDLAGARLSQLLIDIQPGFQTVIQLIQDMGDKTTKTGQTVAFIADTLHNLFSFIASNFGTLLQLSLLFIGIKTAVGLLNAALVTGRTVLDAYKAMVLLTNAAFGATTASAGMATVAVNLFRGALLLSGVGAVILALGFVAEGISKINEGAREAKPAVMSFGTVMLQSGKDAEWAAQRYGVATEAIEKYKIAVGSGVRSDSFFKINAPGPGMSAGFVPGLLPEEPPSPPLTGGAAKKVQTVSSVLKKERTLANRETKLLNAGVSQGFADLIVSTAKTKKAFQRELAKVSTPKGLARQQARFNKTAAGQAELAQIAAETARAAAEAAAELARAQEEAARAEAEALAERQRVYQSFQDSVKNTFAGIKNAIIGAFTLPELGSSTNSIIRNMGKLLERTKQFASSIRQLATMGLDPALLQQIITAGPIAGARLASSLVGGGMGSLTAINAAYGEFGSLASQIASTGTTALFGRESQQTVYNINVSGGVGSGATIGKAIVEAIKDYERTSGAVWQGA